MIPYEMAWAPAAEGGALLLGLAAVGALAVLVLVALLWRRLAQLRGAEVQYRSLFEANPFPMWIYDPESFRFLDVNDAACARYGYRREEFLAMTVLDIRPPQDREHVTRSIREDGAVQGMVWRHITKRGEELEVEILSYEMRWRGRKARLTLALDITARRRAEHDLRRREEQLTSVLNSTGDGIYALGLEDKCQWCNPAAARLLGYASPGDLLGQHMHSLVHHTRADGRPYPSSECEMMLAAREGRGVQSDDEVLWRADGSSFHAQYRSSPIVQDGKVTGVVVAFSSIEPRLRAEVARRQSEERFRALSDSGVFGLAIGAHDGRMVEANEAYLQMLGYTRDDLAAGRVRWDVGTAEEFRGLSFAAQKKLLAGESVHPWRSELLHKSGARVPVLVALVPLERGAISVILDLTELRQAERSLQATEWRYRQIFERNLAGVFGLDGLGRVLDANPAFARIAGFASREALTGISADRIFPSLAELAPELRATGSISNREMTILQPGGAEVPVLANISFMAAQGDQPERIEGTVLDITELKGLERQFLQAQKMESVGQLAGGIAHDFNNLLTVINGYCDLLLRKSTHGDDRHKIELISKAGTRAAGLTRQLLAFSRKQIFQLKVLDLNGIIQDSAGLLRRLLGERFELELRLDPGLRRVHADPNQIEQVLMNLVVNARDAMPRGGRIIIETQNAVLDKSYAHTHHEVAPGEYAMMAVTDSGVGMDAATRARIFEPFFTTKGVGVGTGLGLSTVFGVVKQSGGTVSVYSEPGKGTCMKVYLPLHHGDVAHVDAGAVPPAASAAGSETILLVEDDETVRDFALEILRECGFNVLSAAGPEAALEIAAGHAGPIHLLLSDVIMPNMVGTELADRLRGARPGIRVLFASGYPSHAIVASGALLEGAAFLQKPYTSSVLCARVRAVLDAPADPGAASGLD